MQQSSYGSRRGERNRILNLPEVRLIDTDGGQIGVVTPREALRIAQNKDLDLVEVAPDAKPPVVRIMDYGKYKYKQSKQEKAKRQGSKSEKTKEIKLRPSIGEHDYEFKKNHAKEFLSSGSKTVFTIPFRGREISHPELGENILRRMADDLSEVGEVDSPPQLKGRFMSMVMVPKSGNG
jgi:translation initiation factor IF-3